MDIRQEVIVAVDLIFNEFKNIYKISWLNIFKSTEHIYTEQKEQIFKKMWQRGLNGCRNEDIARAVLIYKNKALTKVQIKPPTLIEFFKECNQYKREREKWKR